MRLEMILRPSLLILFLFWGKFPSGDSQFEAIFLLLIFLYVLPILKT